MLVLDREDNASFETTEMHSVAGGTLVMRPTPYSGASKGYDIRVNSRPIQLWNRQEEEPVSEGRIEVALAKAPEIDGCAVASGRCGAGTRIRGRGVDLELHADFVVNASEGRLEVRPADHAPAVGEVAD